MFPSFSTHWKVLHSLNLRHSAPIEMLYPMTFCQTLYVVLPWPIIIDWCTICLQSGYFASMFSGNWKESEDSVITLDIPDPNITRECMCGEDITIICYANSVTIVFSSQHLTLHSVRCIVTTLSYRKWTFALYWPLRQCSSW